MYLLILVKSTEESLLAVGTRDLLVADTPDLPLDVGTRDRLPVVATLARLLPVADTPALLPVVATMTEKETVAGPSLLPPTAPLEETLRKSEAGNVSAPSPLPQCVALPLLRQ